MQVNIVKEARGCWPSIISELINEYAICKQHTACPICGGKDRYRFDDKDGRGTYYCNGCGAGDGWTLLQRSLSITFEQAVTKVREVLGKGVTKVINPPRDFERDRRKLRAIYAKSRPLLDDDLVIKYLKHRGISTVPNDVRYISKLGYYEQKVLVWEYPAMAAIVRDHAGQAKTLHITYLQERGQHDVNTLAQFVAKAVVSHPKKILTPCGHGAIQLCKEYQDELGIAEGIETALVAQQLFNCPVWAALSANGLAHWVPPVGVRHVHIFGDNDVSGVGQKAAYDLASRLSSQGLKITVRIPGDVGKDWADYVESNTRAGIRMDAAPA